MMVLLGLGTFTPGGNAAPSARASVGGGFCPVAAADAAVFSDIEPMGLGIPNIVLARVLDSGPMCAWFAAAGSGR